MVSGISEAQNSELNVLKSLLAAPKITSGMVVDINTNDKISSIISGAVKELKPELRLGSGTNGSSVVKGLTDYLGRSHLVVETTFEMNMEFGTKFSFSGEGNGYELIDIRSGVTSLGEAILRGNITENGNIPHIVLMKQPALNR